MTFPVARTTDMYHHSCLVWILTLLGLNMNMFADNLKIVNLLSGDRSYSIIQIHFKIYVEKVKNDFII